MKLLNLLFKKRINQKIKHLEGLKKESNLKMSQQEKANIFCRNKEIDYTIKILKEL